MIRHFARHLQQSVFDHIDGALADFGWKTDGGIKSTPVVTQQFLPEETGTPLQPNLVALTMADEGPETEEALGDALSSIEVAFIVDILGENQVIALLIAEDIKDVLRGRINGYRRVTPIYDYTAGAANRALLDSVLCENVDVVRVPGNRTELRRQWQSVRFTAHVEYVPTGGGA